MEGLDAAKLSAAVALRVASMETRNVLSGCVFMGASVREPWRASKPLNEQERRGSGTTATLRLSMRSTIGSLAAAGRTARARRWGCCRNPPGFGDGADLRKHVLGRRLVRRPPTDGRPALARASANDRGTAVRLRSTLHEDAASSGASMNTPDFQAALQETAHGV